MPTCFAYDPRDPDKCVEVEYAITHYAFPAQTSGPAEICYPAEAPEFDIEAVRADDGEGPDIQDQLSDDQMAALYAYVGDHGSFEPPDPFDDY